MQIHETAVVDNGAKIGKNTKVWHFSHIMSSAVIGDNVSIGQNCFVGENVVIGKNVKIQNNVSLYDGLTIEEDVFLGPSVVFTNVKKPRAAFPTNKKYDQTIVKKGATIGANATVVCGVTLGEYCFIGSGTVVTKDIPNNALVVGNPSRIIGWVSEKGNRLNFDKEVAFDEETSTNYQATYENNEIKSIRKIDV